MCGRFALYAPASQIREVFGVDLLPELTRHYNLAPTDSVMAIRQYPGERQADALRWGLLPFWAKDPKEGARMINARSETVATHRAFKDCMAHRRCLVVASAFYEWEKQGKERLPWMFRPKQGQVMAFAGLWASWGRGDQRIESCTILTQEADATVQPIHDRMPVILDAPAWDRWLDPDQREPADLLDLLEPRASHDLAAVRVSQRVNNVRNDTSDLTDPLLE